MENDIQIIIDQIHSKKISDEDLQNWPLDNRGLMRFNALLIMPYVDIKN